MLNIEGQKSGDWIVVDIGDIIVHLFQSEIREFYNSKGESISRESFNKEGELE